jgi:hypothetical protein
MSDPREMLSEIIKDLEEEKKTAPELDEDLAKKRLLFSYIVGYTAAIDKAIEIIEEKRRRKEEKT